LASIATVLFTSVAGGQVPPLPNDAPADLAEARALLQRKEARLGSLENELQELEDRPEQIKALDKIFLGYKKRLSPKHTKFKNAYDAYVGYIKLHENSCLTGNWTEEVANVAMERREREGSVSTYYGPWRTEIKNAADALKKARAAYYQEKDKIDLQIHQNPDVYFPGQRISDYDDFDAAIKAIRLEHQKDGLRRIKELKGTHRSRFKDGEIHRLREEIEALRDTIREWQHTGQRPGSTSPTPPPPPPPPAPPPPEIRRRSPDLVAQIVEVTPSGPIDSAPNRRCVWRFYIKLEERAGRGVKLRFSNVVVEPSRQDDNAKRYHDTPTHRYSWRRGEVDALGIGVLEPSAKTLGPYHLMVWEDEGFAGRFEATFTATEDDGSGLSKTITFTPPPPPWIAASAFRISNPDADDLIGPASCPESGFGPHDQYHASFEIFAPDLPPGLHRLNLAFDPGPTYAIWARAAAGERSVRFHDRIPIPLGRYRVTVSMPDAPQIAPVTLNGRCDPARGSIEHLNKAVDKLNRGNFQSGHQRGDALVEVAQRLNMAGRWAEAMSTATQAAGLLPENITSGTSWSVGGGGGRHVRKTAVKEQATAAYHLGKTEQFLSLMRWLSEYEMRQAQTRNVKSFFAGAGWHMHFAARRLLRMGVHPDQVEQLIERGDRYYRQGGSQNPPRTDWFPR
jgi:hypothetical protein